MTFSATQFKSNLSQGGARPSLFSVELHYPAQVRNKPSKQSKFFVKGTSIPASTVGSYDVYYHGKAIKIAGDRSFETWDTTVINDEDYAIRIALEQWMDLIAEHKLNTRKSGMNVVKEGEDADYKKDIKVTQYKKNGHEAHHYHFLGAFPTNLSAIALDWGTQEIEEFTVTWTYDRWMPGYANIHGLTSDHSDSAPAPRTTTTFDSRD